MSRSLQRTARARLATTSPLLAKARNRYRTGPANRCARSNYDDRELSDIYRLVSPSERTRPSQGLDLRQAVNYNLGIGRVPRRQNCPVAAGGKPRSLHHWTRSERFNRVGRSREVIQQVPLIPETLTRY
jgi:hypothetical protein